GRRQGGGRAIRYQLPNQYRAAFGWRNRGGRAQNLHAARYRGQTPNRGRCAGGRGGRVGPRGRRANAAYRCGIRQRETARAARTLNAAWFGGNLTNALASASATPGHALYTRIAFFGALEQIKQSEK